MAKNKMKTKDYTYIGLCAVLLCISAWITIPSAVPFTMQTFAVSLCAGVLGKKRGTVAVIIYLLLGFVGLPVFSGFKSGAAAIFGATGGYLFGFVPYCALSGYLLERSKNFLTTFLSHIAGLVVCYATGTIYYSLICQPSGGIASALVLCVVPFIIPDLIKIFLAVLCTNKLKKFI